MGQNTKVYVAFNLHTLWVYGGGAPTIALKIYYSQSNDGTDWLEGAAAVKTISAVGVDGAEFDVTSKFVRIRCELDVTGAAGEWGTVVFDAQANLSTI
jgi:hypothetical protein